MPDKQFYTDGTNGTVSIVNYSNATAARLNPLGNLDDVYFHSSLPYLQLKGEIGPTNVTLSYKAREFYTWDDGGGCGGGCFITQACVDTMGLEDDGRVLTTLRYFRDKYMLADVERCMKVADYYLMAPAIVEAIGKREDKRQIYEQMYRDYVLPAVEAIDNMDYERAMEIYTEGVRFSADAAGVQIG